jgi:Putative Actinobacterial Holin-X, holin superfamily III
VTRQDAGNQPVGELVKQLSEQATRLARQEVELARVELSAKGRRAGLGAGMFGGAGIVALFALGRSPRG